MRSQFKIFMAIDRYSRLKITSLPFISSAAPLVQSGPFVAFSLVNNSSERVFLKGKRARFYSGFISLVYVSPLGQSEVYYQNKANEIASEFRESTCMKYEGISVRVTSEPNVQVGYRDGGHYRIPVVVPWESIAP